MKYGYILIVAIFTKRRKAWWTSETTPTFLASASTHSSTIWRYMTIPGRALDLGCSQTSYRLSMTLP